MVSVDELLLSCFSGSSLSLEELELEELELELELELEELEPEDDDEDDDESRKALPLLCDAEAEFSISFLMLSFNTTTTFDSLPSSFEHADAAAMSVRWAFNLVFLANPEAVCNADSPLLSSLDLFFAAALVSTFAD